MMISQTAGTSRQCGFTIIELMVALVINLLIIGGVLQLLSSSLRVFGLQEANSQIQDNARFTLEILKRDIRMAGNWHCSPGLTNHVSPLSPEYVDFDRANLVGTDGGTAPDSIFVAMVDPNPVTLKSPMLNTADALNVGGTTALKKGDVILINDCHHADIMQITNDDAGSTGRLEHLSILGNTSSNISGVLSHAYQSGANVFHVRRVIYRIEVDATGESWLVREENGAAERMAAGIEDMQIVFGEDVNADQSADRYSTADGITNTSAVVSVRLELLLRSDSAVTVFSPNAVTFNGKTRTFDDRKLRKTFTSTISIRNRQT